MEPVRIRKEEHFMVLEGRGRKSYTVADIEALPDGEYAELIDGKMFRMEAPTSTHQEILVSMLLDIGNYIRKNKGNCKLFPAPYGIYIKDDDRHFVMPDISVICNRDKIVEKGCLGAPDWAIEIVSPSSRRMDYEWKLRLYRESGVREYWIVDPQQKIVTVYDLEHDAEAVVHPFSQEIQVGIYGDLYLNLSA
ncbi:MAG: Uma2 family endonuclease [Bacteroidales bacterium]|nr:Uma2 family endonuclease [Bacteroidales bacterium]MCM1414888.1 Uma2 family endonuclease [bacterium]MCM1423929.1 Uma2 family endonuclease [bacterium]